MGSTDKTFMIQKLLATGSLATALRVVRSNEYLLSSRLIPLVPYIAFPANVGFYFLCRLQGHWDSIWLRLFASLLTLPIVAFPRKTPLQSRHKIYWESILLLQFPLLFGYLFLHNDQNTYWYVSLMWSGIFYGFLSGKIYIAVAAYPVGLLSAFLIYIIQTSASGAILRQAAGAIIISWFSVVCSALLKLSADVYYLLSLDTEKEKMRANAAERQQRILELQNAELTARNAIISTFVRPSVLSEIESGDDPIHFKPRLIDKTVMICDMRNFTPMTSSMANAEIQAQFLNKYFEMMIAPVFTAGGEVDKLMGDAVMAIFPHGKAAVDAAMKMRKRLQRYNRQLVFAGLRKISNVITISKGVTLEANIGAERKLDRTWIGPAVNVASRLESIAKVYGLELIVSEEIIQDIPGEEHYRLIDIIKVKGYDRKIEIYELYSYQAPQVVQYKDSTRELLNQGIHLYFQPGKLEEAVSLFRALLEKAPKHQYHKEKVMDSIIAYYIKRCLTRMEQKGAGELVNELEGCHDFSTDAFPREWFDVPAPQMLEAVTQLQTDSTDDRKYAANRLILDEQGP